jgi:NAD(P)-dependent dehydrogenase (short-subunit alcohol dehydrogenase family)
MSQRSHRQTALITGSAKRIGRAMAVALAGQGYTVALHCNRSRADAEQAAQEIRESGGSCGIFCADLADEKQVQGLIPSVLKKYRQLDLLINSASIFKKDNLKTGDPALFNRQWAVNFKAPYILTSAFARKCKRGHIINILDTHIVQNKVSHVSYLLSKKALAELTKMAAVELAPEIRVNAVAPGLILPPAGKEKGYLDRLARDIPLKKRGEISYIVAAVRFLLDNEYLTGQILFVDGGEHLV